MSNKKEIEPPILTAEWFAKARPAKDVLPARVLAAAKRGRPKARETKEAVNIRFSPDILAAFRATGRGWQTRINDALREWLATQHAA